MSIDLKQDARAGQWLGFAVIAFFILIAYAPSFLHGPRSDQVLYFTEVARYNDLPTLITQTYDLNRHRAFAPGDEILFRPLLYVFLATEKFFFGYNLWLWQGLGIVLHLWVVWSLLALLSLIRPGVMAAIWAGFFAFLYVHFEAVTWQHINGYMIALVTALNAFRILIRYARKPNSKDLMWIFAWLLAGVFLHEIGNLVALIFWVALLVINHRLTIKSKLAHIIALPVVIYVAASMINFFARGHFAPEAKHLLTHGVDIIRLFFDAIYAFLWWIGIGLWPQAWDWTMIARTMVSGGNIMHAGLLAGIVGGLIILSLLLAFVLTPKKQRSNELGIILVVCAFIIAGYAALIIIGRGASRGMEYVLGANPYYAYPVWAWLVVMAYSASAFILKRWVSILLAVTLVIAAIGQGFGLYKAVNRQAQDMTPTVVLVSTINELIKLKGQEPDFSFYVDPRYPGNYNYEALRDAPKPEARDYTFAELMYPAYYRKDGKYKLLARP